MDEKETKEEIKPAKKTSTKKKATAKTTKETTAKKTSTKKTATKSTVKKTARKKTTKDNVEVVLDEMKENMTNSITNEEVKLPTIEMVESIPVDPEPEDTPIVEAEKELENSAENSGCSCCEKSIIPSKYKDNPSFWKMLLVISCCLNLILLMICCSNRTNEETSTTKADLELSLGTAMKITLPSDYMESVDEDPNSGILYSLEDGKVKEVGEFYVTLDVSAEDFEEYKTGVKESFIYNEFNNGSVEGFTVRTEEGSLDAGIVYYDEATGDAYQIFFSEISDEILNNAVNTFKFVENN